MGVWKDHGKQHRAIPVKVYPDLTVKSQTTEHFDKFIAELKTEGKSQGYFAIQYFNQIGWTTDITDESYKKWGYIGSKGTEDGHIHMANTGIKSINSANIRIPGFDGVINVLGGAWQNAVYKVIIGGAAKSGGKGGSSGDKDDKGSKGTKGAVGGGDPTATACAIDLGSQECPAGGKECKYVKTKDGISKAPGTKTNTTS